MKRLVLLAAAYLLPQLLIGQANVREAFFPAEGTQLFVKMAGSGEPLIVLHGGPGLSHDYFLPHLEPLSREMQLVLFDQRGMGRSPADLDSTSFSLDLLVEDIESIRKELGVSSIHLMGHSWGGSLAMRYAARYPDRLKSLILCNSVPASSEFAEAAMENYNRFLTERQTMADVEPLRDQIEAGTRDIGLYNRFMQLTFRPFFYDTSAVNRLHLNLSEQYFKTRELLRFLPPFSEPVNLLPDLAGVDVPVLIIRSEIESTPPEADRALEHTFPNARLVEIPRAGHFPFIEKPEEFTSLVSGFIRDHR